MIKTLIRNAGKSLNLIKSIYEQEKKNKTQNSSSYWRHASSNLQQGKDIHSHHFYDFVHVLVILIWQEKDTNGMQFGK